MPSIRENPTFKRLMIGAKFVSREQTFKKISNREAFLVNDNGTSQTHNKITFPKNTRIKPTEKGTLIPVKKTGKAEPVTA